MNRPFRGIGPVPEEALAKSLGAQEGEEVAFFLRQLRLRVIDTLSGRVAAVSTGTTDTGTGGVPGPVGPPGPSGPPGPPGEYIIDLTPPPTPSGVVVSAGINFVFITTDAPTFSQGNGYNRTIVYGYKYGGTGPLPTFADAVVVHEFVGQVGSFAANPGEQWHIWLKWRTNDGVLSTSPQGGTNGNQVTTAKIGTSNLGPLIVEAGNLASDAVTASKLAAEAVTLTAFAAGLRPVRVLAALPALPASGYTNGDTAVLTTDGKLYRIVGGAWTRAVDGADLIANSITAGSISAGAVGTVQLAADAVTTGKLLVTGRGSALNDDPSCVDSSAWTLAGGTVSFVGSGSLSSGVGAIGKAYIEYASGQDVWAFSRPVAIDPTRTYRLNANLYCAVGSARNMYVFVRMFRADGTEYGNIGTGSTGWGGSLAGYVYGGVPTQGQWTRQGAQFGANTSRPIPSDVRTIIVGVWFQYSQGPGGSFVQQAAQDIRLQEAAGADLIVDGSVIATKMAANAIAVGTLAVQDGALVNAMIANATIADAKIVSLSASKITAGSLAVGEYIQSSGFSAGGSGFRIDGGGGVEIRNVGGTRVFHLGASGTSPVLKVGSALEVLANGSATFAGALSAATGTFAGSLSAASGSFAGSLSAATGTFAGSLTAATGSFLTSGSGKRITLNESGSNEARFYGDRGDGTVSLLANIGISTVGVDTWIGLFGSSTPGHSRGGVYGASATWIGVAGASTSYHGVDGVSSSDSGVYGTTFASGAAGKAGVEGVVSSTNGYGVKGDNFAASGVGIYGTCSSPSGGTGVEGFTSAGQGIKGSSTTGHGGHFTGNSTRSALFLTPVTTAPSNAALGSVALILTADSGYQLCWGNGSTFIRPSDMQAWNTPPPPP